MTLQNLLRAAGLAFMLCAGGTSYAQTAPAIAVLDFELVDDQPTASDHAALARRLAAIDKQFRAALEEQGLYKVADLAPAKTMIDKLRSEQEFVYRCNGCLGEIGKKLGVPLVAVGWVQKVSNLILNINVEIRDTATDRMVLTKSVDLRGNTDETWARGIAFMVRDMVERRKRDPKYGR